jgi:hypothetical protein
MRATLSLAALAALVACGPTPVDKAVRPPSGLAEIGCVGAVSSATGAQNVGVVSTQVTAAATTVTLYVEGETRNRTCIATSDGVVQSVS